MAVQGKIIAIDLDGVCADFYGRMREIAAEWFECEPNVLPTAVSYSLREWGITSESQYLSLHRFAVTQRGLFETCQMIPGARRYLRILSNEGARIRIITHRLFIDYFHRLAVHQTIDWLDHYGIPYWDLCFMKEKGQVGADIYIEDNPETFRTSEIRISTPFVSPTPGTLTSGLQELIRGRKFTIKSTGTLTRADFSRLRLTVGLRPTRLS